MKDIHPYDLYVLMSVLDEDDIVKLDETSIEKLQGYSAERTVWDICGRKFRETTSAKHHQLVTA